MTIEPRGVIFTLEERGGDMEIDFCLIGERIKQARKVKGWTQEDLAEKIDVAVAYMSRIESGRTQINLTRLAQLSTELDVSIEELITGVNKSAKNYLDKDLYNILIQCTPEKQRLIYGIAKIVSGVNFV